MWIKASRGVSKAIESGEILQIKAVGCRRELKGECETEPRPALSPLLPHWASKPGVEDMLSPTFTRDRWHDPSNGLKIG